MTSGAVSDALERFVYLSLASAAGADDLVAADVRLLSELAGCGAPAVQKALRGLAAQGLVERRGSLVWVRAVGDAKADVRPRGET